ncbi:MAG TPA: hypothetical protein VNK82_03030 [Terriglobales bacterium]|nr:hypothetical protein [Terriglobales bacterium]
MNANIPTCHYIRTDGRRCGSPALRGQRFCYYHYEARRATVNLDIPPLEDGNAIQVALLDIIRALADDRLDSGKATALGYLLQTAAANLKNVHFGFHKYDMVTDLPAQDPHHRGVSPQNGGESDHPISPPRGVHPRPSA